MATLASRQHGVVTRRQVLACGLSDVQLGDRFRRTLWAIGPNVYAVGHPGISRMGRAHAALLHVGPRAGVSRESAARLWGMVERAIDGPIHVSVVGRPAPSPMHGVGIHRPRTLEDDDMVDHRGIRVTTPERTLLDLVPSSSVAQITRMLEQMVTHLGRSPDDLHAWAHGLKNVRGLRKLHRALDDIAGPAVIRSELESLFRSVCQEGGLPPATTNAYIGRWEVDVVFFEHGVAVELDSWRFHGGRWQFHQDRRKGLAISRAAFELLRITWPQLKHHRAEVIETIRLALERNAGRLGQRSAA